MLIINHLSRTLFLFSMAKGDADRRKFLCQVGCEVLGAVDRTVLTSRAAETHHQTVETPA
jgi:hypothetical protein